MNKLLIVFTLIVSSTSFGAALFNDANIVSTPTAKGPRVARKNTSSAAEKLLAELKVFEDLGSVNCNQNLKSGGHCMLCNCVNEAPIGAFNAETYSKISKVVLSRVKSSRYPSTVCGVVCQKAAFSWNNKSHDVQCQRNNRPIKKKDHFNTPHINSTNFKFTQCIASIKVATQDLLVDHPNDIFALNYINIALAEDTSWFEACEANQIGPVSGYHHYCNPEGRSKSYPSIQSESIAYKGPYRHDS